MHTEHFSEAELACPCCGHNRATRRLIEALEELRKLAGRPLTIRSAYRCANHNREVGGAPDSQHLRGRAADVAAEGRPVRLLSALAATIPEIKGLAEDEYRGYVHLDVRRAARRARWCYSALGRPVASREV